MIKKELEKIFQAFQNEDFQLRSFRKDNEAFTEKLLHEHSSLVEKLSKEDKKLGRRRNVTLVFQESDREVKVSRKEFKFMIKVVSDRLINIEKYPRLINSLLLVYLAALFDAFVSDTVRAIMLYRPEVIRSSKQLTYEDILRFDNFSALLSSMIEREIVDFTYKSFKDQSNFIEDKFGIDIGNSGIKTDEICEILATRNLLIHNKGIVNKIYKDTVPDCEFKIGDERIVTNGYLSETFDKIHKVADYVNKSFVDKFCD